MPCNLLTIKVRCEQSDSLFECRSVKYFVIFCKLQTEHSHIQMNITKHSSPLVNNPNRFDKFIEMAWASTDQFWRCVNDQVRPSAKHLGIYASINGRRPECIKPNRELSRSTEVTRLSYTSHPRTYNVDPSLY